MAAIRVVLVDDHEVVRMGLRMVMEEMAGVRLVGEASGVDEALLLCQQIQPDVVVMDIKMPGRSGVEGCREITQRWPRIRVIMLSSFVDDELLTDAIQAGAAGYVLKSVGTQELVRALQAVARGESSLDPAVTHRVMDLMRRRAQQGNPFADLTKREIVVLHLISQGKTNAEIATKLFLSEKTVRNHVSTIMAKLNVTNRVEAATLALRKRIENYLPEK